MTHELQNTLDKKTFTAATRLGLRLLAVIVVALTAGCFTPTQRINRHLAVNPDRPEAVKQALLQDHQVIPGMIPEEVRFVLGSPERITASQADSPPVWHYYRKTKTDGKLQNSAMWQLPIPLQTVFFGTDNTVTNVIVYDNGYAVDNTITPADASLNLPRENGSKQVTMPIRNPGKAAPATVEGHRPLKPKTVISSYQPQREELNVFGWPDIALQGISTNGREHSAILNGVICEPGDFIGDVRLDAVYANGVALEYRQQRAFLRTGESTAKRNKE